MKTAILSTIRRSIAAAFGTETHDWKQETNARKETTQTKNISIDSYQVVVFIARLLTTVLFAALAVPKAQAGMEWLGWGLTNSPNNVIGTVQIVNDNPGAVYDSYQVKLEDLANQIYSNNPSLHGTYSSGSDLVTNGLFSYSIDPKPTSEIYGGWGATQETNGNISLNHAPFGYETWKSSPGTNTQRGTLSVNKDFLRLSTNAWTTNDLTIANDSSTNRVVGGQGFTSGGGGYMPDEIPRIVVSPYVKVVSTHPWFTNTIGNPSINGVTNREIIGVPYGNEVTVAVDRIVEDPENPGRRARVKEIRVVE